MKTELKEGIKIRVKQVIPASKIVAAILKAEQLKQKGLDGAARMEDAVDTLINKIPFPLNLVAVFAKDAVREALAEVIQETFNEVKSELEQIRSKVI